ncbi:MAG: hypothetical protein ACHQNE_10215, partial [Candidatus Kapaibacterium sp.]
MKRLLLMVFIFMPSIALATPADSMLGPFHLPFQLGIIVHGSFKVSAGDISPYGGDGFGFTFNIISDTSNHDPAWVHG